MCVNEMKERERALHEKKEEETLSVWMCVDGVEWVLMWSSVSVMTDFHHFVRFLSLLRLCTCVSFALFLFLLLSRAHCGDCVCVCVCVCVYEHQRCR